MSEHFDSLLNELSTAFEDRDFQRAGDVVANLQSELDSRQAETRQQVNLSHAFLMSDEQRSVDEAQDVTELWKDGSTTRMTRVLVLVISNAIVESHEELADGELDALIDGTQAAIDDLLDAESQLAESKSSAETVIDQSEIPPSVGFVSTAVETMTPTIDEQTTLTITGENVGERAAADVSLVLSSEGELDISTEQFNIGTIGPGETFERTAEVTGRGAGGQAIEINMNSGNAGSDFTLISLSVQDNQNIDVGSQDDETSSNDGIALSPEVLGGLGIGSIGILYLASRMLSDDDDDQHSVGTSQKQTSQHGGGTSKGPTSRHSSGARQGQPSQGDSGNSNTKRSTQFCPNCGETLSIEAQRCGNCGIKLNPPGK